MSSSQKLVVLGSINADHILTLEHFPHPGQTLSGRDYQIAFGGKGANQAVAAGRSGADIRFIACVGEDDIGQRMIEQFNKDRIDTQAVSPVQGQSTGVALIFVNAVAENCIGIFAGANACLSTDYVQQHANLIRSSNALLLQLETPLESIIEAAEIAQNSGVKVILNPAPARELPEALLRLVDIITPNETEALSLTGVIIHDEKDAAEAACILHSKGIKTVVITMGSRGVWLSESGQGQLVAGFKVNAVDTIAAGDTFNGAFVTALLEGKTALDAARFANAAAAIAVTRSGGQPSVPWREEIDAFLNAQTAL
ncbi:ribokinase [Acinetobacter sp. MD2(2019)]|uniref:ribokinase n=1 Tax=Acinetobacter sp. MD2(2019) TaxID=2605273 RepID=UPI002D1EB04F|nr:ribokinase [Acinetobacter sp. MD2(2019)]MEB3754774.1 ribokinase [Acinetobacter sp. MD2(2019)]